MAREFRRHQVDGPPKIDVHYRINYDANQNITSVTILHGIPMINRFGGGLGSQGTTSLSISQPGGQQTLSISGSPPTAGSTPSAGGVRPSDGEALSIIQSVLKSEEVRQRMVDELRDKPDQAAQLKRNLETLVVDAASIQSRPGPIPSAVPAVSPNQPAPTPPPASGERPTTLNDLLTGIRSPISTPVSTPTLPPPPSGDDERLRTELASPPATARPAAPRPKVPTAP